MTTNQENMPTPPADRLPDQTPVLDLAQTEVSEPIPSKSSHFASAALVLGLVALTGLAWQWFNNRHHFSAVEQTLTKRLEQFGETNQQSLALAKRADERSEAANARAALLEQKMAESQDQQEALQTLYLELANNREERVIAEVEQLMTIANQQLQLAGNVKPALLALQTADSRLQQLDTPMVIQLRKSIAQDIQHLQALPNVDVVGMSLQLETLVDSIDRLPLVSERHPASSSKVSPDWDSNPWRRLIEEVWQDMKGLIRLERVDRPEPPLLAPEQTFFLRENIKLHLLTARIALLQHDEATYRSDLQAAEKWLNGHFDLREIATQNALTTLRALSASNIVIQVPDITESLGLVSKYKLTLEEAGDEVTSKPATISTPKKRSP